MKSVESLLDDLCANVIGENVYCITLQNGSVITVHKNVEILSDDPVHKPASKVFPWQIDTQLFTSPETAAVYLEKRILELLTGKRVFFRKKSNVPDICGIEGKACRKPEKMNAMLCTYCPVAEARFAADDNVDLIYAVSDNTEMQLIQTAFVNDMQPGGYGGEEVVVLFNCDEEKIAKKQELGIPPHVTNVNLWGHYNIKLDSLYLELEFFSAALGENGKSYFVPIIHTYRDDILLKAEIREECQRRFHMPLEMYVRNKNAEENKEE